MTSLTLILKITNKTCFEKKKFKEHASFLILANKFVKASNENSYHTSSGVRIKSNGKLHDIIRDA